MMMNWLQGLQRYPYHRTYAEVTKIAEPYLVGKASASRTQIPDCSFWIGADQKWRAFEVRRLLPQWGCMGVWKAVSWVTRWRLSGLNFRSKKFMLIWDAERPPQTKFQLPNIFCSGEIKSRKLSIICIGDKFRCKMDRNDIYAKSFPHTNDRRFLGFYFFRTKHVWKLKFGLWGSLGIPNQHEFFWPEIQIRKAPSGDPAFQTPMLPHWGSNRRTLKARNFWSASI